MRKISVLLAVLVFSLIAHFHSVAVVYSQGEDAEVTALVLLEGDGKTSKEIVTAIEALGVKVLAGTVREGHPAVLVKLPKGQADAVTALPGVISVQIPPSLLEPGLAPLSALGASDSTRHPGHGPDMADTRKLTVEDRLRKSVMRGMAKEWAGISQFDALSDTELSRIDGIVQSQTYWAVFDDPRVKGQVIAEVKRTRQKGDLTALAPDSVTALQAAADEQTVPVIIELDAPPDADKIAAISSRVRQVRHVFEIINAVSADLTSAQLAAVARLPFVHHIWPDAPVKTRLNESVGQIGASTIHAQGITGEGVIVAVVDNGLQDDHIYYRGRVLDERIEGRVRDHGTHVAGIIAANGSLKGVAPDALLLDAAYDDDLSDTGALWSDVISAIDWAVNRGADVINISLGADLWYYPRDGTSVVETAVDNAATEHGVVVVVAAGNGAERHDTGAAEEPEPGVTNRYWHRVRVDSADKSLQITLWWDDYNNNLDLELWAPSGAIYYSQGSPGSETVTNPAIVYEQKLIPSSQVEVGDWWVVVTTEYGEVPNSPQDYHLSIDYGIAEFTSPNPVGTVEVPATARHALAVGSVKDGSTNTEPPATPANERSDFSAQGPTDNDYVTGYRIKPEIMAPGESIDSSVIIDDHTNKSGTSQAAPHIAGTAALLLEAGGKGWGGDWQLDYGEIRGTIIDTAQELDGDHKVDNVTGAGLVKPTNAIFTGTITHHGHRYFKITPKYITATYPDVTGQLLSFDWESVACHWSNSSNDLDLHLYRLDTGSEVASAVTTSPTFDKIDGEGAISDDYNYVLRVYGWQVGGTEPFTGLSTNDIQSVAPPFFHVEADASNPDEVDKNQTFTIRFNVQNTGGLPALDTSANLVLPPGVEIVSGVNPQNLGTLQPGDQATATWSVRGTTSGTKDFTLEVASDSWGETAWDDSGVESVYVRPDVGPLVYDAHTIDDDNSDESSGNGDGIVNCGETIELFVTLHNQGSDTASEVNATISTSDSYVTWLHNTSSSYPDIAGGGTGTNGDDFEFAVSSNTPNGHIIHFGLDATASNGGPSSASFDVSVTCNHPPYTPDNPTPDHNETNVLVSTNLSWDGGDPDGDSVTYDVYLEANDSTPDTLICDNISATTCDPTGDLDNNTDYYWYVMATDSHDASSTSDTWHFKTANNPPNTPDNPWPAHNATGVDTSTDLTWDGGDPDPGDTVTYTVYLDANNSNPTTLVCTTSATTCDPGGLSSGTDYYWKVVATDNHGANSTSGVWHFSTYTPPNNPPNVPYNPIPINHATGVEVDDILGWAGGDPDPGDTVAYDVYFEANDSTPDALICDDTSATTCDPPGDMSYDTDYYWQVVATDNYSATTIGSVWHLTTVSPPNNAPYTPGNPSPSHNATGILVTTNLSWTGGDPDSGDTVTYDVYFDANNSNPTTRICNDVSATICDPPGDLSYSTDYYWKVVATDNHDASTTGSTWHFTTEAAPPPDVGPLEYSSYIVDDDNNNQSSGNGDGLVSCGETIELYVALHNQGSDTAIGVSATISTTDPYVTWLYNTSSTYPNIVGGGTGSNYDDFDFRVASDAPEGHVIQFDLNITATEGGPWSGSFGISLAACNHPPNVPSNPSPADGSIYQDVNVDLSWTGGDPDGDSVTYDVYLEANDSIPDTLICDDVSTSTCDPGTLDYYTPYYWRVVATDEHGAQAANLTWDFTTSGQPTDGSLVYHHHSIDDDNDGVSSGNDDGVVHCGETIEMLVTIINQGSTEALFVDDSISTNDPYVNWLGNTEGHYYHVPGGATSTNNENFEFRVDTNTPDGHVIQFDHEIDAYNGGPWTGSFTVPVSCGNSTGVVINEVNLDGEDWVEIYNSGDQAVDMTDWHFLANGGGAANYEFPAGFTLQPGAYVVLHEGTNFDNHNPPTDLSIWEWIYWCSSNCNGSAALTDDSGAGVDFVRWGSSTHTPPVGTGWTGSNPSVPPAGQTLARNRDSIDTDDGSDWTSQSPTPGARNLGDEVCYMLTLTHYGAGSDPVVSPVNTPGCTPGQFIAGTQVQLTAAPVDPQWSVMNWTGTDDNNSTSISNTVTMPAGDHTAAVNYVTGHIVVNEIDLGAYEKIELYNADIRPIDLSQWRLVAYSHDYDGSWDTYCTYPFPSGFVLQPGAYVVVHDYGASIYNTETDLYVGMERITWYNGDVGAVALRTSSADGGVDFVRWGDLNDWIGSPVDPPPNTGWTGSDPASPPWGRNLGRDQLSTDTDDGSDWTSQNPSLGEQNLCHTLALTQTGSGGSVPVASPGHSTGCPAGQYVFGEAVNLTANPDSGWHVWGWSGSDDDGSTSISNAVTMPDEEHTATVHYVEDAIPGGIVINELNPDGSQNWIELYNAGSQAVDLTGWRLVIYNLFESSPDADYTFPAFTLQPGAYVVLHEGTGTGTATDLYIGESIMWYANSYGAVMLLTEGGSGVDFVRWRGSSVAPPPGTTWTSDIPWWAASEQTLGRDQDSTDTDDASDWIVQNSTPGAQNGNQGSKVYLPLLLRNH